ncbi:hypothetical protein [Pseudomonas sp. DC3200b2]
MALALRIFTTLAAVASLSAGSVAGVIPAYARAYFGYWFSHWRV